MCSTANDICSIKKGYFFKLLYFALLTDVIRRLYRDTVLV